MSDQPHPYASLGIVDRYVRRYGGGLMDREDAGLPLEGSMAQATAPGPAA